VDTSDVLLDGFGRIRNAVHRAVVDLDTEHLAFRPHRDANSIAWLVWHLTRIQDDHVADVAGLEQVWTAQGWADRFALRLPRSDTGYGHRTDDVAALSGASPELLVGYYDATHHQTEGFVSGLTEGDLDRIVDESWDPPVSLGVRLVSVVADDLQHAGQAAYVRGLLDD